MHAGLDRVSEDSGAQDRVEVIEAEVARLSTLLERLLYVNGAKLENNSSVVEARPRDQHVMGLPTPISFDRARARIVRKIILHRRKRERQFSPYLLADPGWDMLLDLYAAHYENKKVAVSSLCIAAAVPATTALRWIKTLEVEGHLVRSQDQYDGRRILIAISDTARAKMDEYFDDIED
jgi:DNA-binding MarR family transcriptional regulator